jgi:hypothetical protein
VPVRATGFAPLLSHFAGRRKKQFPLALDTLSGFFAAAAMRFGIEIPPTLLAIADAGEDSAGGLSHRVSRGMQGLVPTNQTR